MVDNMDAVNSYMAQAEVAAAVGVAAERGPARGGDARGVWASEWYWHSHADYLRDGNRVADAHVGRAIFDSISSGSGVSRLYC